MDNIAISKEGILKIVENLQMQKDNIDKYASSLKTSVDSINNAWKGADATLYMSKMNDDYSILLSDFTKCLQSYIDFLNQVFSEYEKHDNEYESKAIEV